MRSRRKLERKQNLRTLIVKTSLLKQPTDSLNCRANESRQSPERLHAGNNVFCERWRRPATLHGKHERRLQSEDRQHPYPTQHLPQILRSRNTRRHLTPRLRRRRSALSESNSLRRLRVQQRVPHAGSLLTMRRRRKATRHHMTGSSPPETRRATEGTIWIEHTRTR